MGRETVRPPSVPGGGRPVLVQTEGHDGLAVGAEFPRDVQAVGEIDGEILHVHILVRAYVLHERLSRRPESQLVSPEARINPEDPVAALPRVTRPPGDEILRQALTRRQTRRSPGTAGMQPMNTAGTVSGHAGGLRYRQKVIPLIDAPVFAATTIAGGEIAGADTQQIVFVLKSISQGHRTKRERF